MTNKRDGAFVRVLSNLAKAVLKITCKFEILSPNDDKLGYTYIEGNRHNKTARIFLNPHHKLFNNLNETEKYMASFGVAVHEMLHQCFTNFEYSERLYKRMSPAEQTLFSNIENIFEDSRIEYFGNQRFGGWALKCLKYAINKIWDLSPAIDPNSDPPTQVVSALIQYGDTGRLKGNLTTDEARDAFVYVVENYFDPAITETSGSACSDLALEATRYLLQQFPYLRIAAQIRYQSVGAGEDAKPQQGNSQKSSARAQTLEDVKNSSNTQKSKTGKDNKKAGKQQSKGKGTAADGTKNQGKANAEQAENGKNSSANSKAAENKTGNGSDNNSGSDNCGGSGEGNENEGNGSTGDKGNGSNSTGSNHSGDDSGTAGIDNSGEGVEGEDDAPEDITDAEPSDEEFDDAAQKLAEQLDKAEAQIESEADLNNGEVETLGITNDPEAKIANIIHVRTTETEVDNYADFDEKNNISGYGSDIASELATIFRSKNEGWERSTRGKLNLERFLDPNFNSAFVFDRKLSKANDVAIAMLIDNSGSMTSKRRIDTVRVMAAACAEAFDELGVPFAVYGHDGDYSTVSFYIFKEFEDDQWYNITLMQAGNYNMDGASIRLASETLKKRDEANKVLIVMSDGMSHNVPNAELAIREAGQFATVCGVALATSECEAIKQMYGENFIVCETMEELPEKLTEKLKELSVNW